MVPSARRGCLPGLLCVVLLAGCRKPCFDATETLPAYPGVSSELTVLEDGDERTNALANWGVQRDRDRAVVIRQAVRNDSDVDLRVFRFPPFEAEMIVVETAEGVRLPLSVRGEEFARKRRDPGRGISKVPAHCTQNYDYVLTEWFDLSEPGTYTVEIESRYQVMGKPELGFFETNPEPVRFEVK